jgi:uncharacterized protein YydD (DUF2326 family)
MEVSSRRAQLGETEGRLDRFKFAQEELRISKEVAETLEGEIADVNERISNLDYDIGQIKSSMQRSVMFDLNHIKKIFDETGTYFAPQLNKDYEQLLHFNRTITTERGRFLRQQLRAWKKNGRSSSHEKRSLTRPVPGTMTSFKNVTRLRSSNPSNANRRVSAPNSRTGWPKSDT